MLKVVVFFVNGVKFQSAPGREAGRCARDHTMDAKDAVVSIRARP